MISIEQLIPNQQLPGNLFAPDSYVQGEMELGLIESRHGSRLLALPDTLLRALQISLDHEVGPAANQVLRQCGHGWGKNFYRRFSAEVENYYGKPLSQMTMAQMVQSLKECWKTYGWGLLDLDFSYYQQGFLVVEIQNSAFAHTQVGSDGRCLLSAGLRPVGDHRPSCFVEAGLLSAFFSQLTDQNLDCVQTTCESMQADSNRFVLGLPERVKVAEAWLEEAGDHQTIMTRLVQVSTDERSVAISQ